LGFSCCNEFAGANFRPPNNEETEVIGMEHYNLAEIYAEVKKALNEFAEMWQGWSISVETIYERDAEGLWLLKYGENVLRPLHISIIPERGGTKLPWISLVSNEKVDIFRAEARNRRYLRSYFERLTEYLVLEAAQAPAIVKAKLYVRKSGKHFRLHLPACDEYFGFSFYLRKRGWTWKVWRWFNSEGWVLVSKIYRPLNENPIEAFVGIIDNIGLALL
jgi:hypothetical protein